jgi:hypothetical protein
VIAVYLRSNTQQHSNSSTGGSPHELIEGFSIMPSWKDDGQDWRFGSYGPGGLFGRQSIN